VSPASGAWDTVHRRPETADRDVLRVGGRPVRGHLAVLDARRRPRARADGIANLEVGIWNLEFFGIWNPQVECLHEFQIPNSRLCPVMKTNGKDSSSLDDAAMTTSSL